MGEDVRGLVVDMLRAAFGWNYRKFSAERRQNLGFADPSNLS